MNEFFIFNIKNEFYKLYKNRPSELFFVFNRIYKMKSSDKEYGFNLFSQVSNFLDKNCINNYFKNKYNSKIMYSYNNNEHIINNIFLNEISILSVKSSNMKLESNINNPSFFKDIKEINGKYFVCNFKSQDYFFLDKKTIKS